jgi:pimeloyl-ACP methyl ester carboxylesterase
MVWCLTLTALLLSFGCPGMAPVESAHAQVGDGLFGLRAKTMGGRFSWTDEVIFRGWRIQKSGVIGHYRLLDASDQRMARGTFEHCLEVFEAAKRDQPLEPLPEQAIVVLHGLGAGRQFMQGLVDYLETEGGYSVVNFGYASTMGNIEEHAQALDSVIRHLDGVKRISFVAHSMGNIVVRRYLYDMDHLTPAMRPQIKFERMVMISPPNHGATVADKWGDNKLVQMAAGEPLEELAPEKGWPELEKRLETPKFEFGIIAGGRADEDGYLPGVPGDDDGLLSIETHKLKGAVDFVQTKGLHQLMPKYKQVRENTLRFLQEGCFDTPATRQPID